MLDFFKGIACILVVVNHFHHAGVVGQIEYTISHLGVPLFFLVSGYFLYRDIPEQIKLCLPRKIAHSFMLTLWHLALYIAVGLIALCVFEALNIENVISFLSEIFTCNALMKTIVFSATLYGWAIVFMGIAGSLYNYTACIQTEEI